GPKGLDDALRAGVPSRLRRLAFTPGELGRRAAPERIAEAGLVQEGEALGSVRARVSKAVDDFVTNPDSLGKVQVISASQGSGKSRAVAEALDGVGDGVRVVTRTLRLAAEMADEHGYNLIEGRSAANCERYDVARELGSRGF